MNECRNVQVIGRTEITVALLVCAWWLSSFPLVWRGLCVCDFYTIQTLGIFVCVVCINRVAINGLHALSGCDDNRRIPSLLEIPT